MNSRYKNQKRRHLKRKRRQQWHERRSCDRCGGRVSPAQGLCDECVRGLYGQDYDHDWRTESRVTEPPRSTAHPGGASPPEYEQPQSCTKCGATRGGSDE